MFSGIIRKVRCGALILGTFLAGASILLATPVFAATGINEQLNFQGRLLNAQGATAPDGYYNVEFKLYQDGSGTTAGNPGGTLLWTEAWLNSGSHGVVVRNGYISVQLGSINPFGNSVDWNQDTIWLSVNIGDTSSCTIATDFNTDCGGDGEMLPMKRMSAVPYALNAAKLGGLTAAGFIQNTTTVQTSTNMTIDGTARADTGVLTPAVDTNTATALNIGTTNATSINLNQNVIVAADKTLTLTGGATRPASPTEGMLWYDTTTKQLLIYANGKWQADRSTSTKIVAASNASQALKDGADYVTDGTDDQTEINAALTAAAGGKVYLTEGTFTVNGSISVPNNTTLAGAGAGTVIRFKDGINTDFQGIVNSDTATGTNVTVKDIKIDGNRTNQTAGLQIGIYFNGMGGGSNTTARAGGKISNVFVNNIFYGSGNLIGGIVLNNSSNTIISNNTIENSARGISLVSSTYNTLTGNLIQGSNSASNIYLVSSSYNTITGNTSQGSDSVGAYVTNSSHNTFTGNVFQSNAAQGININTTSSNNIVASNKFDNNGGTTNNNAIYVDNSDSNTITGNSITDSSATTTNYAINISNSTSDTNYLADNTFSSTPGTSTINDAGTGTVYANQARGENGAKLTNRTANSTEAFAIQNAAGSNIFAVDTSNNQVVLGNNSTAGKISMSDGSGYTATITMNTLTANRSFLLPNTSLATEASPATICVYNGTSSNCPAATGSTFYLWNSTDVQDAANLYIRSADAGSVVGVFEGEVGQTADLLRLNTYNGTTSTTVARFTAGGDLQVAGSIDTNTATALNVGTTNATSINLNQSTVISADKALTLTGGTTRPASPTEGMMWYDTVTKQLLTYSNGKWQSDRSTATKIVAASNASQALKDGADYVATGTGDQTVINNALTAAAGGKVYLTEGTYTINGSVSIPNNTTLTGAGSGTIITIPNGFNSNINAIVATDTTTGSGVTVSNLRIDGNKSNNTSGTQNGIYFNNMGGGSGSSARQGTKITNSWITGFRNAAIMLENSSNSIISDNHINNSYYGLYTYVDNYMTVESNIIQGNTRGVNASATNRSIFTGNMVESNSGEGILIFASSYSNTVSANNFNNNSTSGISLDNTSDNEVSGNKFRNNGTSTANEAIVLATTATNNTIVGNSITDSAAATTNFAIDINSINATSNYLADNTLGGGSINDQGTGTIYGGQVNAAGNYLIQPAGTIELLKNTNVTGTLSASTSVLTPTIDVASAGTLSLGTSTATAITIGKAGVTTTIAGDTGVTLNATTGTTMVCRNTSGLLSTCDATYVAPTATNFIQNQNGSQQTGNFRISGTGQADTSILTPLVDTATAVALNIGTTNATSINLNQNVTVAANKSLTLTGGSTASRPASPTEGMVYFDTTTKQLLVYSNGKWQSDRSTSTKIVAASNASQALKDSADYVATGTGDQTVINTALTAAAGGKVYLTEGTYSINDVIFVPANTTLAGAGYGTLVQMATLATNTALNLIESDGYVTIQDIRMDGNASTQSGTGEQNGYYSWVKDHVTFRNNWITNFKNNGIIMNGAGSYTTITGNTTSGNLWGIYLTGSHDVVSNNISDGDGHAITVAYGASHTAVTGNTVHGSTENNGAIDLYQASDITISGNTIDGQNVLSWGAGILVGESTRVTVTGNHVSNGNVAGIMVSDSSGNVVSSNVLYNNGGATDNEGIVIHADSDSNTVTSNTISDTSATNSNYAVDIDSANADTNYLASNTLGGGSINDAGTGTVYGGQVNAAGNYLIQPAGTIELLKNTNVTGTLSASTSVLTPTIDVASAGTLSLGTSTATAITIGKAGVTTTIAGDTGVTLNATTGTTMVCRNTSGLLSTCDATYVAPTATNFIQNQNASQQTGNFRISGTGQADTSILTPLVDTATAVALNIGTNNATSISLGKSTITTTLSSRTINVGTSGGSTTIAGATQTTSGNAGNTMTIKGSDGLGTGNGGNVTLQAGNSGLSGAYGGNLTLSGGTGTSANGLVIINTATYSTSTTQASATSVNITQANIDSFGAIILNATASGVNFTLTAPTLGASAAGRVVYVTAANGSQDFTLRANVGGGTGVEQNIAMRQNTTATMIWNGSQWTAAGASSSTTLQAAYDNTLQSAGGAELIVSKTSATNGLTIRDSSINPVSGALLTIQSSSAANLFSVNSGVTEYTSNSGAETYSGTTTTFPASTWVALTGSTVTRNVTTANIATGQGSAQVVTSTSAGSGVKNVLNTSLTAGQHYNVSFSAKLSSGTFTDMGVYYSIDGTTTAGSLTTCTTSQAVKTSVWTKVNCIFTAPSTGITAANSINIIQAGSGTARTFYVDNISVTIAADYNYATDGGVNDNTNFGTNWTSVGTATVARYTSDGEEASDSAQVSAGTTANNGVKNKLSINPLTSTLYRVSVYAKLTAGSAFTDFKVRYTPDNGTNFVDCVDYNTQTVVTTGWTQITCYINTSTTTVSNPYVQFIQPTAPGSARTFLIDAFSMTLASNTTPNVQVGSGSNGGPTTLFTLDKAASAPIAANNDALLGSMYYDTTLGKLQCYEADGWGACGSSPDNIVTISPEYTNAVMHGTGVGTMTSDFCSDMLNINDPTNAPAICGANETYNFYKWTSPQPTTQTYSIYVTYQLPSTFKAFASGQTSLMGKTDSANSSVTYQVYRNNTSSGLSACGGIVSVSTGVQTAWQTAVATGAADPSTCGFAAGDSIVFKINVSAASNADAYVGNLGFTFSNK